MSGLKSNLTVTREQTVTEVVNTNETSKVENREKKREEPSDWDLRSLKVQQGGRRHLQGREGMASSDGGVRENPEEYDAKNQDF